MDFAMKPLISQITKDSTSSEELQITPPKRSSCNGHSQAWTDFRLRWKTIVVSLWLTTLFLFFGLALSLSNSDWAGSSVCTPDGLFQLHPEDYRYWTRSGVFQITLGWGTLDFTSAKVIDVAWDVVVGRGGQAFLAFVSWRIFARYVTTSMEVMPATFNTYQTVFLHTDSLVVAIPRLIRDFTTRHSLHSKVAMISMIATLTFLFAFPTLASAMTGYSANVRSFVLDRDANLITFEKFRFVSYIVHDADRIGMESDVIVPNPRSYYFGDPSLDDTIMYYRSWGCSSYTGEDQSYCYLQGNVSAYVGLYGFYGAVNKSSNFMGANLTSPVLNISAFYIPAASAWGKGLNGSNWTDPETHKKPFADVSQTMWTASDQLYNSAYLKENGTCQAEKSYRWGFSVIQLNLMLVFLLIWTIDMFGMWWHSHRTLEQRGRQDIAGEYKAIIELADAMRTQFDKENGEDISVLTEANLRRRIKQDLRGGSISYTTRLITGGKDSHGQAKQKLSTWLKGEVWWLVAIVISFVVSLIVIRMTMLYYLVFLFGLPFALVFSVLIGSTVASRLVLLLWWFAFFGGFWSIPYVADLLLRG